jgi:hypothetical protein
MVFEMSVETMLIVERAVTGRAFCVEIIAIRTYSATNMPTIVTALLTSDAMVEIIRVETFTS